MHMLLCAVVLCRFVTHPPVLAWRISSLLPSHFPAYMFRSVGIFKCPSSVSSSSSSTSCVNVQPIYHCHSAALQSRAIVLACSGLKAEELCPRHITTWGGGKCGAEGAARQRGKETGRVDRPIPILHSDDHASVFHPSTRHVLEPTSVSPLSGCSPVALPFPAGVRPAVIRYVSPEPSSLALTALGRSLEDGLLRHTLSTLPPAESPMMTSLLPSLFLLLPPPLPSLQASLRRTANRPRLPCPRMVRTRRISSRRPSSLLLLLSTAPIRRLPLSHTVPPGRLTTPTLLRPTPRLRRR